VDLDVHQPDSGLSSFMDGLTSWEVPRFWKKYEPTRGGGDSPVNVFQVTSEEEFGTEEANSFSNMEWSAKAVGGSSRNRRRVKRIAYVRKYAPLAIKEMKAYGIPASITLAQGLLESNAGESALALKNRNHFGIKCFSRRCHRGHCSNFYDDHHKDFFRIYDSVGESYRAHSKFLQKSRYRKLFKLKRNDYKGWARGLKKAGYATDPRYAEKLIALIEDLELYRFDR
jgi:flagellum-specific peptidoglycan hydrolase FlgJ